MVASTLILGLSHGGSVTVLYGLVVVLIVYGAVALSLAEFAARYTTAGGPIPLDSTPCAGRHQVWARASQYQTTWSS